MRLRTIGLFALFAIHAAVSVRAMAEFGYFGLFEAAVANWGAGQVFSDLCVALTVLNGAVIVHSRRSGVPAWPFVLASLPLGSFAPIAYFLVAEWRRDPALTTAEAAG